MAENGKKWLLGSIGAVAVAVGGGAYELVKPAIQEYIKRNGPGYIQNAKDAITNAQTASAAASTPAETETAAAEEAAFQAAYDECNSETGSNPDIDLNNEVEVHRANLKCLIIKKNQGAYLDKRAASDSDLRDNLQDIRNELTQ